MTATTLKVLLCFGQQKKFMSLPETANREAVVAVAEECFNVRGVILQHYEPDFDEWVNLEDAYTPANKEKVQVLPRDVPGALTPSEEVGMASALDDLVYLLPLPLS